MSAVSSELGRLVPLIKDAGWKASEVAACRTLCDHLPVTGLPWLAFGWLEQGRIRFAAKEHLQTWGCTLAELEARAVTNLISLPAHFGLRKLEHHGVEVPLATCVEPLAAERLLDVPFLRKVAEALGCRRMGVAIPRRDLLLATPADQIGAGPFGRFAAASAALHAQAATPVSPLIFLVERGKVAGAVRASG